METSASRKAQAERFHSTFSTIKSEPMARKATKPQNNRIIFYFDVSLLMGGVQIKVFDKNHSRANKVDILSLEGANSFIPCSLLSSIPCSLTFRWSSSSCFSSWSRGLLRSALPYYWKGSRSEESSRSFSNEFPTTRERYESVEIREGMGIQEAAPRIDRYVG